MSALNDGFRVLDEFVCEAVNSVKIPATKCQHSGQNEGMSVLEEVEFDAYGNEHPMVNGLDQNDCLETAMEKRKTPANQ